MTLPGQDATGPDARRRRLAGEVLELRWESIAHLAALAQEPRGTSYLWPIGLGRLVARASGKPLLERRRMALAAAAVALAWAEAIDQELGGE